MSFLFAFWTMELDLTRPCSDCCPSPGLGTSTAQEAKEYFSDMARHRIPFKYSGPADDEAITLVITFYTCTDIPFLNSHSIHVFLVLFFLFFFMFCFQAFSKKKVEERKDWLTSFMVNRRQRREHNLPEVRTATA